MVAKSGIVLIKMLVFYSSWTFDMQNNNCINKGAIMSDLKPQENICSPFTKNSGLL